MAECERLREQSCMGNIAAVKQLIQAGVCVNSQNSVNGWTPLHWACKRNHFNVAECLLNNGADSSISSNDGSLPVDLTNSEAILSLLSPSGHKPNSTCKDAGGPQSDLPIIPNYLKYPAFPYSTEDDPLSNRLNEVDLVHTMQKNVVSNETTCLIKVRIADSTEKDFVEFELENITFSDLLKCCCEELEIVAKCVLKIRKLPNILIRKDADVCRLTSKDYLELVLKTNTNV